MKRIIICSILAVVIFCGGTAALIYTDKVADRLENDLHRVKSCYLSDDVEGAKEAAGSVWEQWKKFRQLHMLTVNSDHTIEITMSAVKIINLLERQEDKGEVITECNVMEELIRVYKQEQTPSIENIL